MKEQIFTVEYPLIVEKWQADILDKRFEIARKLYNELLSKTLKKYNEMVKTKEYRGLLTSIERDENGKAKKTKRNKEIWGRINDIQKANGFTKYGVTSMITPIYKRYSSNMDSNTVNSIAVMYGQHGIKYYMEMETRYISKDTEMLMFFRELLTKVV